MFSVKKLKEFLVSLEQSKVFCWHFKGNLFCFNALWWNSKNFFPSKFKRLLRKSMKEQICFSMKYFLEYLEENLIWWKSFMLELTSFVWKVEFFIWILDSLWKNPMLILDTKFHTEHQFVRLGLLGNWWVTPFVQQSEKPLN